jgi:HAE1 family hydrophobic/amphiphilic exporter-1
VGNWRAPDDENYDVNVRWRPMPQRAAATCAPASTSPACNADGSARIVRLNQVADIVEGDRPQPDQPARPEPRVAITPTPSGRATGDVSADIKKVLDDTSLAARLPLPFGGSTKNMKESFGYAVSALGLAIIFIYMILASQFRSFLQPLSLMSSLPLTLIGVVLALLVFGSTLSCSRSSASSC